MAPPEPKRLYQAWKGSNRFFCGGRMIFGPDVASLLLTTLLIGAPALTFCYQVYKKLVSHDQLLGYTVLVVGLIVTILDIVFLLMTSGRDPGIVPRNLRPPESIDGLDNTTPSMEWVNGRTPHLKLPRTRDVIVNGHSVKVKFCDTCLLYRPPRASHCSICNNCVQRFDHHCPWVGQCIGLRNYRFFFLFISCSTFLCLFVFTFSWVNVLQNKHNKSVWRALSKDVLSVILIVYCFVAIWFVGGLTVFHSYLMCTNQVMIPTVDCGVFSVGLMLLSILSSGIRIQSNIPKEYRILRSLIVILIIGFFWALQTTYENFRYRYDKNENPYNRGFVKNIKEIFFSKIPLSMNNFRSWIVEDDVTEIGSITPTIGVRRISSKEKIDIEMGSKLAEDNNMSLPDILQNLDYSDIEENEKTKDGDGSMDFETYFSPTNRDSQDLEQGSIDGNNILADDRTTSEGQATTISEREKIS